MAGYIHIAASGETRQESCRIKISNVSATAYDSYLHPRNIRTVESYVPQHDTTRQRALHGNLATLRVLPTTANYVPHADSYLVNPTDFSQLAKNSTDFSAPFKHSLVTLTLSKAVDISLHHVYDDAEEGLEKPVTIQIFKHSFVREAYQMVEIKTLNRLVFLQASYLEQAKEIDSSKWHRNNAVMSLEDHTVYLDQIVDIDRMFVGADCDDFRIIDEFQSVIPKLVEVMEDPCDPIDK